MCGKSSVTRREFGKQALAAGAAASVLTARNRARAAGANDRIAVGIIDCGGQGRGVMQRFMAEGADILAVCDPDARRTAHARQLADDRPARINDFRALLDWKDIDAVLVATPDHWHAIPAIQACDAAKDVYVEKPLSYSVAEGRAMVNAARRTKRIVQVGMQQRSAPHYHEAAARIQRGDIGVVSRARVWNIWNNTLPLRGGREGGIGNPPDSDPPPEVDYELWLGPAPKRPFNPNRFHWNYVYFWDYAGGMMTGWGVHHVDIVHWALKQDTPRRVTSVGGNFVVDDMRETPDTLDTLFEYDGFTVQASMYHGNARPIEGRNYGIAFYGTKATMILTREEFEIWPEGDASEPERVEGEPGDRPHVRNFIDCCRTREQPVADAETGHKSTIPVLLANIAYRTGRALEWDGVNERVIRDAAANQYLSRDYQAPWRL